MVILIFILFGLTTLSYMSTNIWLSKWTDNAKSEAARNDSTGRVRGLAIYSGLGVLQGKIKESELMVTIILKHTTLGPNGHNPV
jgi:hypothetical protein